MADDDFEFEVVHEEDLTIPEDKICPAVLSSVARRTFKWTDTNDKDRPGVPIEKEGESMIWWFEVTDGDYQGRRIRGETRPNRSGQYLSDRTGNKFRQWSETLLGRELEVGARISKQDIVGLRCEITVKHRHDKKDPSKIYEEIDEVIPITGGFDFTGTPPF